ncbi:MAG TPA: amidophosphoribosyltransferase, partial [bacterium]|nr:amidophosphoribosyltransferase [bacterium]
PCLYGIDTATRDELIANNLTLEMLRDHLGANSLEYLSINGLVRSTGAPKENFCMACLTGDYPVRADDEQLEIPQLGPHVEAEKPETAEVPAE